MNRNRTAGLMLLQTWLLLHHCLSLRRGYLASVIAQRYPLSLLEEIKEMGEKLQPGRL